MARIDLNLIIIAQPRFPHGYAPTGPAISVRHTSQPYVEIDGYHEEERFSFTQTQNKDHRLENTNGMMEVRDTSFLVLLYSIQVCHKTSMNLPLWPSNPPPPAAGPMKLPPGARLTEPPPSLSARSMNPPPARPTNPPPARPTYPPSARPINPPPARPMSHPPARPTHPPSLRPTHPVQTYGGVDDDDADITKVKRRGKAKRQKQVKNRYNGPEEFFDLDGHGGDADAIADTVTETEDDKLGFYHGEHKRLVIRAILYMRLFLLNMDAYPTKGGLMKWAEKSFAASSNVAVIPACPAAMSG